MIDGNITLTSLIDEGSEVKKGLRYEEWEFGGSYKLPANPNYQIWKNKAKRFLAISFQDDFQLEDFNLAIQRFEANGFHAPDSLDAIIGILVGYSSLPQKITVNNKTGRGGISLNVTNTNSLEQSQNQSQAVAIFLNAIKYDVAPRQLDEIKQIISGEDDDLEKAKPRILDKVLSWGGDVLAGVVTNLITNPEIFSNL